MPERSCTTCGQRLAQCACPPPDPSQTLTRALERQRAARSRKEEALALLRCYDDLGASPVDMAGAIEKIREAFLPPPSRPPHRPQRSGLHRDEWDFLMILVPTVQKVQADGRYPSQKAVADCWPGRHSRQQIERWFHTYVTMPFGLTWQECLACLPDFIRALQARG